MQCNAFRIAYNQTGYFSSIVSDYVNGSDALTPFYQHLPNLEGIRAAIAARKLAGTNRQLLVQALTAQYAGVELTQKQQHHLQQLGNENTFTICTAHQPNIFTGHLYFIYKILHTVKLSEALANLLPECNFVPVYYMGSEDADLDELGHIFINGEKYTWQTDQTGAVGRMIVDKSLVALIDTISGQLLVGEFGAEVVDLMKSSYQLGSTIEQATFKFVHELFAAFGLLVLLPDSSVLKRAFVPVMKRELAEGFSYEAVQETMAVFPQQYKVQASGRETNLFYLNDGIRERIEAVDRHAQSGQLQWRVVNTNLSFSHEQLLTELENYPERFSPNVILRPVFQEFILPNIAFIGGGGEIAYWLELKKVFKNAGVPFPVLVVRNSFLLIGQKDQMLMDKLQFGIPDLFKPTLELFNLLVQRDSEVQLSLQQEMNQLKTLYQQIKVLAGAVDITLQQHTDALQQQAVKKLTALEKKMLRAEKKKFAAMQHQLTVLRKVLFPNDNLQERIENFMPFYAQSGPQWLQSIYHHSLALEQEFVVLTPNATK